MRENRKFSPLSRANEPRASIPLPDASQVYLDFDGTITKQDVLDELVRRFAVNESWKAVEEQWQAGLIGSYDCLKQQLSLVRISPPELREFLDNIGIDPGFDELLSTLQQHDIPCAILSDGIDLFIRHVLSRAKEFDLSVRANSLNQLHAEPELQCRYRSAECESAAAHCKCASADQLKIEPRKTIYVGDGRSDLCPARKAHLVFAKNNLARLLEREQLPFIPFETLTDVARTLACVWDCRSPAGAITAL